MVDLHTHSTVSDGSDPPARIPELAAGAGCTAVALTDHDRLDGVAEAGARAEELGVDLVPGCEVSCEWAPGTLHVLVYFVEPGEGPLQDELSRNQRPLDARAIFRDFVKRFKQSPLLPEVELALARSYEQDQQWGKAISAYDQGRLADALIEFRALAQKNDATAQFMAQLIEARLAGGSQ